MANIDVLAKIRGRGHWDIAIHPGQSLSQPWTVQDLSRILQTNTVRIRGWPVPFIDDREPILRGNEWIGQDIDAWDVGHYEAWRFFTSAQFTQLRGISADWRQSGEQAPRSQEDSAVIEVWEILFYLTELAELAARLVLASSAPSFVIDAALVGMRDRVLISGTPTRELDGRYVFSEDTIRIKEGFPSSHLIAEPRQVAIGMSTAVLTRFGFHPSPGVLEDYQRELLGRS